MRAPFSRFLDEIIYMFTGNAGACDMLAMFKGSLCAGAASRTAAIASIKSRCVAALAVATRRSAESSCRPYVTRELELAKETVLHVKRAVQSWL